MITKSDRNGHHSIATDTDVVPIPRGTYLHSFELSEAARQRGAVQLVIEKVHCSGAQMNQILAGPIFAGKSVTVLTLPAWGGFLGFLVVGLIFANHMDRARDSGKVAARRLKGPELLTVKQFNRWSGADGISFLTTEKKFLTRKKNRSLSIPRSLESSHIIIMGDTGAGKSVLQRRILTQIAERGETAIVYDAALEYTPEFFNPARGDLILNPLDARCPYWSPADEILHEAEALTLAASLFPNKPYENTFFVEGPRKIFAHLLTLRPTPEQLVEWMSHEEELDRLLKGTELEAFVYRGAGPQRGGVLGALNMVADCLKLLPRERDANERWTTEEWARQNSGWLFDAVVKPLVDSAIGAGEKTGSFLVDAGGTALGAVAFVLTAGVGQAGGGAEREAEKRFEEKYEKEKAADPEAASGGRGVRSGKKDRSLHGNVDQLEGVQQAQRQTNKSSKGQYGLGTKKSQQNIDNANKKIKSLEDVENQ